MFSNSNFWDKLAVQSYKAILKNKPGTAIIHNNLGLAYLRLKLPQKAVRSFQRAIKLDKTPANTYYHLGCTYEKIGKRAESIRFLTRYSKLTKNDNNNKKKQNKSDVVEKLIKKVQSSSA